MADLAPWLGVLIGSVLLILGVLFVVVPEKGFELSGHASGALPAVMAGRYVAFGVVVIGFVLMADWRAVAFVLAVGAAMGVWDALVAGRTVGGKPVPHLFASVVAAAGAYAAWSRLGL